MPGAQPLVEFLEPFLQPFGVLLAGQAVGACRPILAGEPVGLSEESDVDPVGQTREYLGLVFGLLGNPLELRGQRL